MQQASAALAPQGLMLVQTLAQNHAYFGGLYEAFMQRYVFEHYSLTSLPHLIKEAFESRHMRLLHVESLDDHCARTIRDWYVRFNKQRDAFIDTGLTPQFLRLFEMKMAMIYAGVCSRDLQCVQLLWGDRQYRGADWLLSHSKSSYFPSPYLPEYDKPSL
jgi:cyclopropane fatty-acyl-phospholipid synthase-like methyltransferase